MYLGLCCTRINTPLKCGEALHDLHCKSVLWLDDEHRDLVQINTKESLDNPVTLCKVGAVCPGEEKVA